MRPNRPCSAKKGKDPSEKGSSRSCQSDLLRRMQFDMPKSMMALARPSYLQAIYTMATCALLGGCVRAQPISNTGLEDGIYRVCETNTIGRSIQISSDTGVLIEVYLQPYTHFLPRRVLAFPAQPEERNWYIQIEGVASDPRWTSMPLVVLADGTLYYDEISKTGTVISKGANHLDTPAILSFKVPNAAQAHAVVDALRRRYAIKAPSPSSGKSNLSVETAGKTNNP